MGEPVRFRRDEFSRRISRIGSLLIQEKPWQGNNDLHRHLFLGLLQRLSMIEFCCGSLAQLPEEPAPALPMPLATEVNVAVNALYLNLRGSLDNLAWALAYRIPLRPDRFGDGPVRGEVTAMRTPQDGSGRTPEDIQAGDLVVLDVPTWPNMASLARGGARIVQIMSKRPGPNGIEFEFLDAGPSLQPLSTPTCSVALNASAPLHAMDVTVSNIAAGRSAEIRYAATDPGAGSVPDSEWVLFGETVSAPGGNVTIPGLPSGSKLWAQARAI